jgi:hypothetical protein
MSAGFDYLERGCVHAHEQSAKSVQIDRRPIDARCQTQLPGRAVACAELSFA